MKVSRLTPVPNEYYDILHYPKEGKCSDIVLIKRAEADAYYEAASACFEMVDKTAEYVIQSRAYEGFGIPEYMFDVIEDSFNRYKIYPHMLGRFDFAGGLDGKPIKMIEFNADTPFSIFESAVVQYGLTKANGYDPDNKQYNYLFEALQEYFKYLKSIHVAISGVFSNAPDGEDDLNTQIIMEAAENIIQADYAHWGDLGIDRAEGLCSVDENGVIRNTYSALFKMIPYDMLIKQDPDMMKALVEFYMEKAPTYRPFIIGNPFYSVVYQSKELMRLMSESFPDSPYLLKTSDDKSFFSGNYVKKPKFGREGENISLYKNGFIEEETFGEVYKDESVIYQEVAGFNEHESRLYQAGVFVSMGEPCCLSFRRSEKGKKIIHTDCDLCGHLIED